jgi:PPOX class probable F420-dependent enzyme
LTTTDGEGAPQPRPVWFIWDGESFLLFSRPRTAKISHIRRSPKVALHFDVDGHGGDIVVMLGEAVLPPHHPPANEIEKYVQKYTSGFERIHMTPEQFAADYSTAILVTPTRIRGH